MTPEIALERFSCWRLGARVWDIRQILGAAAIENLEPLPDTPTGNPNRFARYRLRPAFVGAAQELLRQDAGQ